MQRDGLPGLTRDVDPVEAGARARRVFLELRLAENEPVRGLTIETPVQGSTSKTYVHYTRLITNADLLKSTVVEDGGRFSLALTLDRDSADRIADATRRHRGRPVALVLDGEVRAVWTIRMPLGEQVVVPTDFSQEEAIRISSGLVW